MRKITAIVLSIMLLLPASCSGKTNGPDVEIKAEDPFMTAAISEALEGIYNGDGGPFGL